MHIFTRVLAILSILGTVAVCSDSEHELKLLHVILRHGQRTPADTYPKDPYISESFEPFGWGQLTNKGKLDMFENGEFIRHRYNDFLGDIYNARITYVLSTDSDRTKMTAQLMDAGIWPPNKEQQWGPLKWQPIPVRFDNLNEDNLLLVRRPCAQYHLELDKVMSEGEVKEKLDQNQELFTALSSETGLHIKDFDDIQSLYSTLKAEEGYGLTLPDWTKQFYPEMMQNLTEYSYIVNAFNDKLKRLKGGVLLKKLLVDWHQVAKNSRKSSELEELLESKEWIKQAAKYGDISDERKLFLYAGHDSTITNLLRALNVWEQQLPDYGITIMLELLKNRKTNEYGVQIYLRNSTTKPPHLLTIPGCANFCPLHQLTRLVDHVIPRDLVAECQTDDPNYVPPELGGP